MNQTFYEKLSYLLKLMRNYRGHPKSEEACNLHLKLTRLFQRDARLDMNFARHNPLSDMEMIALGLRALGHDRHRIAHVMETKASTIRTYEDRARKKLNAHSLTETLYIAAKRNYLMIMKEEECPHCYQLFCLHGSG